MLHRSLFAMLMCLIVILPASAQTIIDITYDEDILVRLTEQNPTVAYDMPLDSASTLDVAVRYLGTSFSMTLEIFDMSGEIIATEIIDEASTISIDVPAGENLLLLTADAEQSGRAVVRFNIGNTENDTEG